MELYQGLLGTLGLVIAAVYSMFVWLGGRDVDFLGIRNRIWGRVIAPVFFSLALCALALLTSKFNPLMLLSIPAYLISHTTGYGGDDLWTKIMRRTLWSTIRTSSSATFALFTGTWTLFVLQAILGLLSANVLGIQNPLKAPQEEGLNSFLAVVFVPFMVL